MDVRPLSTALEEITAALGEVEVAKVPGQLLDGAQGAEVPKLHLRIWPIVFNIHGVVLAAFHHPVAVGIPAARNSAELESLPDVRPKPAQERVIPGQLPFPIDLQQATHLTIGCGFAEATCAVERQADAETHEPMVVRGMGELDIAHRAGQAAEQERGGDLVIPDVGARPMTAATLSRAAFEPVKPPVRGLKTGLGAERAQIEQRGFPVLRLRWGGTGCAPHLRDRERRPMLGPLLLDSPTRAVTFGRILRRAC